MVSVFIMCCHASIVKAAERLVVAMHAFVAGDCGAILPHVCPPEHERICPDPDHGPCCIGSDCTVHMGWGADGVFAGYIVVPATNVVRLSRKQVQQAAEYR
jgi:threonine dehydrogenase-like Zn-dependent dehydrogenase